MSVEIDMKDYYIVNYLKSIQRNYLEMFEATNCYHSDERLTKYELKIIDGIYDRFYK